MNKLNIAILDSGVNVNHPLFKNDKLDIINYSKSNLIHGHGTAIYSIIRKVNGFSKIVNFQITNNDGTIDENILIDCLNMIYQNYNFDLINLSLGINLSERLDELEEICEKLYKKGTIIISAFDNTGSLSYPASFKNVIGVTSSEFCEKVTDFVVFKDKIVNIGAKGTIQRVAWLEPNYIFIEGNSFACAHVSVQVANFLYKNKIDLKEIINKFKEIGQEAKFNNLIKKNKKNLFAIKNAVIFPFNKEMHSLIRYEDLLNFNIVDVYDYKYSAYLNSTTNHIMKDNVKSFKIKNVEKIDWETFDTIIIGHIPIGANDLKKIRNNVIINAIEKNKNIFSFDDIEKKYKYNNLYCPKICKENLEPERYGKLYRILKPILGIYGTSSIQGKFSLQLELRKRFLSNGYKIGQIGTEASSLLFGFDYDYPMGFNNSVYIYSHDCVRYLNNCINELTKKNCDIIITGSQGSILPFDVGNISYFPLRQQVFLQATQPDAVVLCINPFDDSDYIDRSIKYIEASVDCKVIAICVFPFDIDNISSLLNKRKTLSNERFLELENKLNNHYKIPIYKLGDENHLNNLFESIIDYFSE